MRVDAPAKLNLRLAVLAREASGYHQIETLFIRLELADTIEIALEGKGVELEVTADDDLGPATDNLAYRAAAAFLHEVGLDVGVHVKLTKRIPAGAGLGGGSSDAAATMLALESLTGVALDSEARWRIARSLGSDVPFFVSRAALAFGWGRGDRLLALPAPPPSEVLLIVPRVRVSTAEAYATLSPSGSGALLMHPRDLTSWPGIAGIAYNDFERGAAERHRGIAAALECARSLGGIVAGMTGTGSAVYAIFEDVSAADRGHDVARAQLHDAVVLRTRTAVDRPSGRD